MAVQDNDLRYSLKDLLQLTDHTLEFDEDIEFSEETYKSFPRIRRLSEVHASGRGLYQPEEQRLYLNLNVKGIMTCPCDVTFEDVDIPFNSSADEVISFAKADQDNIEILQPDNGYIEMLPIIFRQILVEVPIKVRKEGNIQYPSGEGWRVISEQEYEYEKANRVDPRLAALKDYKPQE